MRHIVLHIVATVTIVSFIVADGACQDNPPSNSTGGFDYPRPTGDFPVGTRYLFLEDSARLDGYTEDPDDHRWISVKVWYPAAPSPGAKPAPYGDDEFNRKMVEGGFFDAKYLAEVALKPSASYQDAPVAPDGAPWPILIYSSSGVMTANIFLFEELASHGYAVFVVGHPYWCEFYFDGQGELFYFDKSNKYYTAMWEEEKLPRTGEVKELITRSTDAGEKLALHKELNRLMPTEVSDLALWQEDVEFLVDRLVEFNQDEGPYRDRLDTDRIGILGYSKGGALAGQVCATSDRFRAGVNLGGFTFGGLVDNDLTTPFMTFEHVEPWCPDCTPINLPFYERSGSDTYMIRIEGGTHATFTDLPVLSDYLIPKGVVGTIDGRSSAQIIRSYLLAFVDTYVKGTPKPPILDQMPSRFEAVKYTKRTPG